ncbi:MAG: cupin domain-containing protein [Planctomycetaceae bacterium]|nr:cupin domain-containing protein [Planctomycetaceae bacterium]
MTAKDIIKMFNMIPLPDEGGFYVETYRASEKINNLPARYEGRRTFSTAILYLITPTSFSKLHKVKSDEVFHFHLGDPVEMLQINETGKTETQILGTDCLKGQKPQAVVYKDTWQGTKLVKGGKFALLGCTVAPGFEFADYISADRDVLIKQFPNLKKQIELYL